MPLTSLSVAALCVALQAKAAKRKRMCAKDRMLAGIGDSMALVHMLGESKYVDINYQVTEPPPHELCSLCPAKYKMCFRQIRLPSARPLLTRLSPFLLSFATCKPGHPLSPAFSPLPPHAPGCSLRLPRCRLWAFRAVSPPAGSDSAACWHGEACE